MLFGSCRSGQALLHHWACLHVGLMVKRALSVAQNDGIMDGFKAGSHGKARHNPNVEANEIKSCGEACKRQV